MSTIRVDGRRRPLQALEKYPDAAFVTDNLPLYFGTDGDTKLQFSSANTKLVVSKADIRFSDTTKLEFGDAGDATINWDATKLVVTGDTNYSGGDITFSDTAKLTFGSSTVVSSDQHIYHHKGAAASDCLVIAGLTARRAVLGCVFVSDGFLKIVV